MDLQWACIKKSPRFGECIAVRKTLISWMLRWLVSYITHVAIGQVVSEWGVSSLYFAKSWLDRERLLFSEELLLWVSICENISSLSVQLLSSVQYLHFAVYSSFILFLYSYNVVSWYSFIKNLLAAIKVDYTLNCCWWK